jgi:hypothetical protein
MDFREETTDMTEIKHQHKRMKCKTAVTSRKQEDTQQNPETDPRAGDSKANSRVLRETPKSRQPDIVEGLATS